MVLTLGRFRPVINSLVYSSRKDYDRMQYALVPVVLKSSLFLYDVQEDQVAVAVNRQLDEVYYRWQLYHMELYEWIVKTL